jgi:hypothetical protein
MAEKPRGFCFEHLLKRVIVFLDVFDVGLAAEHQRIERVWCVRWIFSLTGTNSTLTGLNTKSFRELTAAEIARLTFETVEIREFKIKQ